MLLKYLLGEGMSECKHTRKQRETQVERCSLKFRFIEGIEYFLSRITQEGMWGEGTEAHKDPRAQDSELL